MPSGAVIDIIIWLSIAVCISQSAMFSGMNLAVFSISRLRLEAEAAGGNADARRLLEMRQDANFLWLGPEGLQYFRESDLREVIKIHMAGEGSDVGQVEGVGAINFLAFDDVQAGQEGEPIDPESVLSIPLDEQGMPVFPKISNRCSDPFLKEISRSGKKWAVLVDTHGAPHFVLDVDGFIRTALLQGGLPSGHVHCHRPIVVTDAGMKLGAVVEQLKVFKEAPDDDVIDHDIILVWSNEKRIITGADILGRLMRGITKVKVAES